MAQKAKSVVDTILGEALAGNWQDMLGIASVIDNRAKATNVTPEDVISAPNQFDAYGKALPPGVDKYRDMAVQAVEQVKTLGPVHNATFYATPAATKNLPSGLAPVAQTAGHQYFADPQNRSIRTAQGYKRPDPTALQTARASLPDVGPVPASRPSAPTANIAGQPSDKLYDAVDDPTAPGLAGLSPSFNAGMQGTISSFDRTNLSPSALSLADSLAEAGFADLGVNSGYRSPSRNAKANGAKNSQHMLGNAIDLETKNLTDFNKSRVLDAALSAGAKGIGAYPSGSLHVDTRAAPAFWGPNPRGAYKGVSISQMPGWAQADLQALVDAGNFSYLPSGINNNVPTPQARPDVSAPVERAALDAPGSFSQSAFNDMTPDIGMPSAPTVEESAPSRSFDQASFNAMTPEVSMPSAPEQTIESQINAMTPEISMPAGLPDFSAVTKATNDVAKIAGPVAPEMVDLEDRVIAPLTPAAVANVPNVPSVPAVARPAAAVLSRPTGTAPTAPAAPARAATGQDVWSGRATSGIATNGNQMTRNPDGTVTMTSSKYGYTETMNPDGSFKSTTAPGLFGLDAAAKAAFGNMRAPDFGSFNVKGAISGAAKGAAFGIPGMAVGAFLGGFARPSAPSPAQARQTFQRGYTSGLGFPDRPSAPSNSGSGEMTSFGEAASRGDFGGQAQTAANNPGTGLF